MEWALSRMQVRGRVAFAMASIFAATAVSQESTSGGAALLSRVQNEVVERARQRRDASILADLIPPLAESWADTEDQAAARAAIAQGIQQILSLKDGLERASALLRIAKAQLRMGDRGGADGSLALADAAARAAPVEGEFAAQFKLEILGQIPRSEYRKSLLADIDAVRAAVRNPDSSRQKRPSAKAVPPGGPVFEGALAVLRSVPKAAADGEMALSQWESGKGGAVRDALESARGEIRSTPDPLRRLQQFAALAEIGGRTGNRALAASLAAEGDALLGEASSRMSSEDRLQGLAYLAEMRAHAGDSETAAKTYQTALEGARAESGSTRCSVAETVAESEVRAGFPEEAARTAVSVTGITNAARGVGAYFPNAFEKTYNCADLILDELVQLQLQRAAPKDALATAAYAGKPVARTSLLCAVAVALAGQGDPAASAGALQQARSGADGIANRAARDYVYLDIAVALAKTGRPEDGWVLARRIADKLQRRDAVRQVAAVWARTDVRTSNTLAFAEREPDAVLRLFGLAGIVTARNSESARE